jgi:bifunctional damage-control phosphatase, subfamily II, fusion protein
MIFVDNAGADAVLGIVPLARELLCMGADVVLVANSLPAINDITAPELAHLVDTYCAPICGFLAAARAAAHSHRRPLGGRRASLGAPASSCVPRGPKLLILGSGSGGPCLDLRRIGADVAAASIDVQLVIIEGMGRAVHTNFNAALTCPTLKLAMIKTQRVAEKLFNGTLFDCLCRFDMPGPDVSR